MHSMISVYIVIILSTQFSPNLCAYILS